MMWFQFLIFWRILGYRDVSRTSGTRSKKVWISRTSPNIDRKPKVVIVVKHPTLGDSVVYCAEQYEKVKVEGEPDGFFDKKVDLPINIANAPTFSVNDIDKPIDTSVIDKMGWSTRSEDIALAQSQGLDVDDDNEPAPENIPAAGTRVDSTTYLQGQEWGWNGTCYRKTKHHLDVNPQILNHSRSDLCNQTKLDMFLLFFPLNYTENVVVKQTSCTLVGQAYNPHPLSMGEFVRFFQWSWLKRLLFLWSYHISGRCTVLIDSIHAQLLVWTNHELFNYYNKYTRRYWSILGNEDVDFWVE
jgi:hypothetical protein